MTTDADLERALDRVIEAARAHLQAVRQASDPDDDQVWSAYVRLNNESLAYDELLEETYGEVTPWEVSERLSEDDEESGAELDAAGIAAALGAGDGLRISVRQRRDYLVPEVEALLRSGTQARAELWEDSDPDRAAEPVASVGEAVYELLHSGGGTLAALDVPELVPQSGLVLVNVVDEALSPDDLDGPPTEADELFTLADSPLILSLYEPMYDTAEDEADAEDDDLDDEDEDDEDEDEDLDDEQDTANGSEQETAPVHGSAQRSSDHAHHEHT